MLLSSLIWGAKKQPQLNQPLVQAVVSAAPHPVDKVVVGVFTAGGMHQAHLAVWVIDWAIKIQHISRVKQPIKQNFATGRELRMISHC